MTHKTLEQLAKEAGMEYGDGWCSPNGADGVDSQYLARFRALCMEEAAQIVDAEFVGEYPHDGTLCQSDVAYNMALKHAAYAIREAAKQ